jgi:peptidoglycan/LPS O-acetylase OafA/YrhL
MIAKPQKLDALTSLRFFAAAMIVIQHSHPKFGTMDFLFTNFPLSQGVSFFFVLSGFILAYNYPVLVGETDILAFFKARIARIWPAHIAAIALLAVLTENLNVDPTSLSSAYFMAVANFFLLQSLIPIQEVFFSFNSVAWSITTEMFFYFAFPLLIANNFFGWRSKLLFLVTIVGLHFWFASAWNIDMNSLKSVSVTGLIYINPVVRVLEFFIGVLTYFCFLRLRHYANYPPFIFTVIEIVAVLLTLVVMYYSIHLYAFLPWRESSFASVINTYIAWSGSSWIFPLIIIIFAIGKGQITKVLSLKPMVLLGEISFSLYLVHVTILEWYRINAVFFENQPKWSIVLGYWLLALLIAYLLHKIIENPCRKLLIALPKLKLSEALKILFLGSQATYIAVMTIIITLMLNLNLFARQPQNDSCPSILCQSLAQQHALSPFANFGGYIELTAVYLSASNADDAEYRELDLLFNVLKPLPEDDYNVAIHLVTADGKIVSQSDFTILNNHRNLSQGQWVRHIKIPAAWLKQGSGLGIAVFSKKPIKLLNVIYPKTDYDGKRVLIDFATINTQ